MKKLKVPIQLNLGEAMDEDPNEVMRKMYKQALEAAFEDYETWPEDYANSVHMLWSSGFMTAIGMVKLCQLLGGKEEANRWIDATLRSVGWSLTTEGS